ncbi:MAG: DUF1565 domain-containing protein [Deltaproteobacteria bacterium]|nr:DUF1565 domain-containing protein [Deltaproteobacteria bacterium]
MAGLALALTFGLSACTDLEPFRCSTDADCGEGACFGRCAVADSECESGFSFDESAGPDSGQCVEQQRADDPAPPESELDLPEPGLYVDATAGDDLLGNGSKSAPYRTLTHALSASDPGAIIKVAPGRYDADLGERFPIRIPEGTAIIGDLADRGQGETDEPVDDTLIAGDALVPGTESYKAALVPAQGSIIAGLAIQTGDAMSTAGVFLNNTTAEVRDCSFLAGFNGVRIEGGGSSLIRNNYFDGSKLFGAIYSWQGDGNPEIANNTAAGLGSSISFQFGEPYIHHNTIERTRSSAIYAGGGRVEANNITGQSGIYAVCLNLAGPVVVRSNHCTISNALAAVRIRAQDPPDLGQHSDSGNNELFVTNTPAILLDYAVDVTAIGNDWSGNFAPDCEGIEGPAGSSVTYYPDQTCAP